MNYHFRAISRHRLSFFLAVSAAGMAMAGAFASLSLQRSLHESGPAGTSLSGEPVSLFQHADANQMDFFLSPRQVEEIDNHLAGSGRAVASSGARLVDVSFDGKELSAALDFVSPAFFKALRVQSLHGGPMAELRPGQAVISERLLAKFGGVRPAAISVADRRLEIVAVARTFGGLWDHDTDVWCHWRDSEGVLLPPPRDSNKKDVAFHESWFYWTLAVPAEGRLAEFRGRMIALDHRTDIATAPFDRLKSVAGISNQLELRDDAESSLALYQLGAGLLLLTAVMGLSAWSALTRIERIGDERVFATLGMPRSRKAGLLLGSVLPPIVAAVTLAALLEPWMFEFISRDVAIAALLEWSPDLSAPALGPERAAFMIFACTVSVSLNQLLARAAADSASPRNVMAGKRVGWWFNCLMLVLCANATGSVVLALAVSSWHARESQYDVRDWSGVHALRVGKLRHMDSAPIADATWRETLRLELLDRVPGTSVAGFMSPRPYSSARPPLELLIGELGEVQAMRVETDAGALVALGLKPLAGRSIGDDPFANEWVVDATLARRISGESNAGAAVGMQVRDTGGDVYTIVGVVDAISYRADLNKKVPVYYAPLSPAPIGVAVVLRRSNTNTAIDPIASGPTGIEIAGSVLRDPVSLAESANEAIARRDARTSLALIVALGTAIVSIFVLIAIARVHVHRQRQALALRAALGATRVQLTVAAFRSSASTWVVGAMTGAIICVFATRSLRGLWDSAASPWLFATAATLLGLTVMAWVAWRNLQNMTRSFSLRELLQ